MFLTEKNLLEFLMRLGRATMGAVFQQLDTGYEGAVIRKDGRKYKFVGYRRTSLHGLFGMIEYRRAYYFSRQESGGGYFPQDKKLGIQMRHTPRLPVLSLLLYRAGGQSKESGSVSRDLSP